MGSKCLIKSGAKIGKEAFISDFVTISNKRIVDEKETVVVEPRALNLYKLSNPKVTDEGYVIFFIAHSFVFRYKLFKFQLVQQNIT